MNERAVGYRNYLVQQEEPPIVSAYDENRDALHICAAIAALGVVVSGVGARRWAHENQRQDHLGNQVTTRVVTTLGGTLTAVGLFGMGLAIRNLPVIKNVLSN